MPKKSRKSRAKRKAQSSSRLLAAKEGSQRPQPLPLSSKPAPVAKPTTIVNEQEARYYKYRLSDVKRSIIIAAVSLSVLLILYFFLR